ncbi:MAG: Pfs, and Ankyrin domain protein [Verrucomicrobiales bacterium]|nr:Pfs, and Ankyrin domain protein [Verrucomicrobiales bacterium]
MTFETVIKSFTTRGLRVEDVCRYLDAGGDVRRRDEKMGWSLLHFGAEDRNPEAIRLLVVRGADLSAADRNGWTPLHLAVDGDMIIPSQAGRRATELPTVQTLIELGADETARASDGRTPRDIAVAYGQEVLYDSLLRRKAA